MQTTITIHPLPPYDFDLNAGHATYFRARYGSEIFEDGVYRRLLDLGESLVLASIRSTGDIDSPRLEVQLSGDHLDEQSTAKARLQVERVLGTDDDITSFYDMAKADQYLAPLVQSMWGLHTTLAVSAYEAIVQAILGQQISSHVARMLRTLMIETYGPSVEIQGEKYYAHPRPEALATAGVEGLRAIKFSLRKAEYVSGIAEGVASGELDLEGLRGLPADEVVKTLTAIRGVGPWTAHMLLIRALGYSDGFPHGDLAIQRAMGVLVNGGEPMSAEDALDFSHRWSPYRSYVTTYLFATLRAGILGTLPMSGTW